VGRALKRNGGIGPVLRRKGVGKGGKTQTDKEIATENFDIRSRESIKMNSLKKENYNGEWGEGDREKNPGIVTSVTTSA